MEPTMTVATATKTSAVTVFALFGLITVTDHDATAMFLGLMGATTRLLWKSPTSWKAALVGALLGIMLSWHLGLALLEYMNMGVNAYTSRFILFTIGFGANMAAAKLDGAISTAFDKPLELLLKLVKKDPT